MRAVVVGAGVPTEDAGDDRFRAPRLLVGFGGPEQQGENGTDEEPCIRGIIGVDADQIGGHRVHRGGRQDGWRRADEVVGPEELPDDPVAA